MENILNVLPRDQNDSSNDDNEFWKGIKSQLTEIAKLTYQTDEFSCQCGTYECPFNKSSNSLMFNDKVPRRMSAPASRMAVSYGGFESMRNMSNFEMEIEEEECVLSSSVSPFQRRQNLAFQVRRGKRNSASETSPQYKKAQTFPRK